MPQTPKDRKLKPPDERTRFTIPVFPYVRKFMLKNYPHKNGVFRTEEYTVLGKIVTLALRDNRGWKAGRPHSTVMDAKITLELTTQQMHMGPRLIKLMTVNVGMDMVFKDTMKAWIQAQMNLGVRAYPACQSFLEFYDLDGLDDGKGEYGLYTAYKNWQRTSK